MSWPLADDPLKLLLLSVAIVLLGVAIARARTRRARLGHSGRSHREDPPRPAGRSEQADLRQAESTLQQLLDELEALADRIDAQAVEKTDALHRALAEADRKLAALDLARSQTRAPARAAAAQIEPADAPVALSLPTPAPAGPPSPEVQQIETLFRAGVSPDEICRRLHRPIGEVELAIQLCRFSAATLCAHTHR